MTLKRTPLSKGTKQLKRSAFKTRSTKPKKAPKTLKTPKKGYQVPKWFKSIPLGSHGNTPTQKKYWKVISDFTRQRDFNKYRRCVSCPIRFETWNQYQGGHYKPYSNCNSYFKFSPIVVHAQCPSCNYNLKKSAADVGHAFGEELKRRYGKDILKKIEKENLKHRGQKLDNQTIVENVEKLLDENPWFVLP